MQGAWRYGLIYVAVASIWTPALAQEKAKIEIVSQVGHSGNINSIAISRDGKFLLSGGFDNSLKLWLVDSGVLLRTFVGHSGEVTAVALSPDAARAYSSSRDKTVKVWETSSGRLLQTIQAHAYHVTAMALSIDGTRIVTGGLDGKMALWNANTGTLFCKPEGHPKLVQSVAFSRDGKHIVSGGEDNALRVWDGRSCRLIRTLQGHTDHVISASFSPAGAQIASGSHDRTVRLWDADSGRLVRIFRGHVGPPPPAGIAEDKWRWVRSVAFSPDGARLVSGNFDRTFDVWDVGSGSLIRTVAAPPGDVISPEAVHFSFDGKRMFSGGLVSQIKLWDAATWAPIRTFEGRASQSQSGNVLFWPMGPLALFGGNVWDTTTGGLVRIAKDPVGDPIAFSSDGTTAFGISTSGARQWDTATGLLVRKFGGHDTGDLWTGVSSLALSSDGRTLVTGGYDKTAKLWEVATGRLIKTFDAHSAGDKFWESARVGISPDGSRVAVSAKNDIRVYDAATGQLWRTLRGHTKTILSIAISPKGDHILSGGNDKNVRLWDARRGTQLRVFAGHSDAVRSVGFSPDGGRAITASADATIKLWDVAKGTLIQTLDGHMDRVDTAVFSPEGARILSKGIDGTAIVWRADTGERLATLMKGHEGLLTMLPAGFFSASSKDGQILGIVRGLDAISIDQVYQSLYDPNLVRESLAGDPDGEVKRAAAVLNLETVLDSGKAPSLAIIAPVAGSPPVGEIITAEARIGDEGGGIGRIEWRVNGVTVGVVGATREAASKERVITQTIALEPGENTIEVVAYNGRNLLASLPASTTVTWTASGPQPKPKLFVIAVGIDDYSATGFSSLRHAVADAKAFGAAMKAAGEGLYDGVDVTYVPDAKATAVGLEKVIDEMGAKMHPRDTFIFFAAAHGKSEQGRFHLIPHDYRSAPGRPISEGSIGQDKLQDWFANRIKARRGLILLDTCESGALVASRPSGMDAGNSEVALGRLNEATGRPVLTAAAADQVALEGYKGHGIFTYALLDAFSKGDTNNNGTIELSELTAHIQNLAPQLSRELRGSGKQVEHKTRAAITTMRDAPVASRYADFRQKPRVGSRGEDFAIGRRLSTFSAPPVAQ